MEQIPIKLTFESMIALIQGKELHIIKGENHFVFLPPVDGVFVTHEQLAQMRTQDQQGVLNLLKALGDHRQE